MEKKHIIILLLAVTSEVGALTITPPSSYPDESYILQKGQNFTFYCSGRENLKWKKEEQKVLLQASEGGFMERVRKDGNRVALDLINVNEHTVGYYACSDASLEVDLNDLTDAPKSTDDVHYIYVYVNGTESSFADMKISIIVAENTSFVIPCRPTTPDVNIELFDSYTESIISRKGDPRLPFDPKIGYHLKNDYNDTDMFTCMSKDHNMIIIIKRLDVENLATPDIHVEKTAHGWNDLIRAVGESLKMTCTIETNEAVKLEWRKGDITFKESPNNKNSPNQSLVLTNLQKKDAGEYQCFAIYGVKVEKFTSTQIEIVDAPFLDEPDIYGNLLIDRIYSKKNSLVKWRFKLKGYPGPNFTIYHDNKQVYPIRSTLVNKSDYTVEIYSEKHFVLAIANLPIEASGDYVIEMTNGNLVKNTTVKLDIKAPATVKFTPSKQKRYQKDVSWSFECEVSGNPEPKTDWVFYPECPEEADSCEEKPQKFNETARKGGNQKYVYKSIFQTNFYVSGNLTCNATNGLQYSPESGIYESPNDTIPVLLYEVEEGFEIFGNSWVPEQNRLMLECKASKYDYTEDISWYKWIDGARNMITDDTYHKIENSKTSLSYTSKLRIETVSLEDSGTYACEATRTNHSTEIRDKTVDVKGWYGPRFLPPTLENGDLEVKENLQHELNCTATGIPVPKLRWFHDDIEIPQTNETILNDTIVISKLILGSVTHQDLGSYKCEATDQNGNNKISSFVNLKIRNMGVSKALYLSIIGAICFAFIILVAYLIWKVRKERRYRIKLYNQFNNGDLRGIDPGLTVDEQAERLPYDKRFEFPPDKLIISNTQLGRGAFGEVYKAEARGIIDAEKVTTVAVKKVKQNAEKMYVDALISELKIMIHMGRHLNIVNLLGACTKKIAKRELMVILEYCKFGNIHKYMQTHRKSFVDTLPDSKNHLVNGVYNRGFYNSPSEQLSDGLMSDHTPVTGHTIVNTTAETAAIRSDGSEIPLLELEKVGTVDSEYVEINWRSNYDYKDNNDPQRKLTTHDLISWAYQIALGMEYLASKKILHGDLAARNILLAEDNIVKICDFGLARNIQKNNEYKKQSNDPVPVKWLALECLMQQMFSTQSDVWAYGVVLWELFSLANTPYPGKDPKELVGFLEKGERMEKPRFANDTLYDVMRACWEAKPSMRPTFTALHRQFGEMIERSEKERFKELNESYLKMNEKWRQTDGCDYLAGIMAPNYFNSSDSPLPTPSYVNAQLQPPQLDPDGYLQVSPRSQQATYIHRPNGEVFKFDQVPTSRPPRLATEPSAKSERTPMLPENNENYIQVIPDSIAEEDEEEISAVENPSYNVLNQDKEQPVHSYSNLIYRPTSRS